MAEEAVLGGTPVFSVVVLSQSNERELRRALQSVRAQAYPGGTEVVVIETGATNGARRGQPEAIDHLHRPGPDRACALNAGISGSRGEFVTFLDARDELLPITLELYTHHLRKRPAAAVVYGRAVLRDASGRLLPAESNRAPDCNILEALTWRRAMVPLSSFACRRSLLDANPFPRCRPGLETIQFLVRLVELHCFSSLHEDVAIVDERSVPSIPPAFCCYLFSRRAEVLADRLGRTSVARCLAELEERTFWQWYRAGRARRALVHARRAQAWASNPYRARLLSAWLQSRLLLQSPTVRRRFAA